jgi:hypothetical protein
VGGSVAFGVWFALVSGDTCCSLGPNVAADVRIAYRWDRRVGVHLAFEEQYQITGTGENLAISALWTGLNW